MSKHILIACPEMPVLSGIAYHVMARCLDGQTLFADEQDREFVQKALGESADRRLRIARYWREEVGLEDLVVMVGQRVGIEPTDLRFRSRVGKKSLGRKLLA